MSMSKTEFRGQMVATALLVMGCILSAFVWSPSALLAFVLVNVGTFAIHYAESRRIRREREVCTCPACRYRRGETMTDEEQALLKNSIEDFSPLLGTRMDLNAVREGYESEKTRMAQGAQQSMRPVPLALVELATLDLAFTSLANEMHTAGALAACAMDAVKLDGDEYAAVRGADVPPAVSRALGWLQLSPPPPDVDEEGRPQLPSTS